MSATIRAPSVEMGGFKQLLVLFLPISLMTFISCLFILVEKVLLARLSVQAMESAVNASYASLIFQAPGVALVMMTQVFVGRWFGAQEWKMIGPGVWQFIWFALLSILVTIPSGVMFGHYYFHGTAIENSVFPYYYFLLGINFLYPLGSSLACFYIGQSKTRLVVISTISSQIVKLLLGYLLIFGWGWIPAFGLLGGAIGTLVAQGGFCLFLFWNFLKPANARLYNTREWQFKPKLFWSCIQPGLLRAINRILGFGSWAAIAHLMAIRGGEYILILSIGGALFLFLPFLGDALCQAQTTIVSQILGAKKYNLMDKAFRSGALLSTITTIILCLPLVIFPIATYHYLFPDAILDDLKIKYVFWGIWLSFAFFSFTYVPISYILAFKDTKFSFFMGFVSWINGYLLMYVALDIVKISAEYFWFALVIMHSTTALFYYMRMRWLQTKVRAIPATA